MTLHWEQRVPPDKSYAGAKRYSIAENHASLVDGDLLSLVGTPSSMLNRLFSQLRNDVCADALRSIGVYALLQGERIPDGLYYFDSASGELVALPAGSSTGSSTSAKARRANIERLCAAFPTGDYIRGANITLFFTGIFDRVVWRYKEAAYRELQIDAGSYAGLVSILAVARWHRYPVQRVRGRRRCRGARAFAFGGSAGGALHNAQVAQEVRDRIRIRL